MCLYPQRLVGRPDSMVTKGPKFCPLRAGSDCRHQLTLVVASLDPSKYLVVSRDSLKWLSPKMGLVPGGKPG